MKDCDLTHSESDLTYITDIGQSTSAAVIILGRGKRSLSNSPFPLFAAFAMRRPPVDPSLSLLCVEGVPQGLITRTPVQQRHIREACRHSALELYLAPSGAAILLKCGNCSFWRLKR